MKKVDENFESSNVFSYLCTKNKIRIKYIRVMTQEDKEKITKFLKDNLRTHTDWTGTYVEYHQRCDSVEEFIEIFFNSIEKEK